MYEISEIRGTPISTRLKHFICDTTADIANLPTNLAEGIPDDGQSYEKEKIDVGSTALVTEDSSVWILSPNGTWVEL